MMMAPLDVKEDHDLLVNLRSSTRKTLYCGDCQNLRSMCKIFCHLCKEPTYQCFILSSSGSEAFADLVSLFVAQINCVSAPEILGYRIREGSLGGLLGSPGVPHRGGLPSLGAALC